MNAMTAHETVILIRVLRDRTVTEERNEVPFSEEG